MVDLQDASMCNLAVTTITDGYTSQGHKLEIVNNNGDYDPLILHSNKQDMTGEVRQPKVEQTNTDSDEPR